jgi:hypothetical protein
MKRYKSEFKEDKKKLNETAFDIFNDEFEKAFKKFNNKTDVINYFQNVILIFALLSKKLDDTKSFDLYDAVFDSIKTILKRYN